MCLQGQTVACQPSARCRRPNRLDLLLADASQQDYLLHVCISAAPTTETAFDLAWTLYFRKRPYLSNRFLFPFQFLLHRHIYFLFEQGTMPAKGKNERYNKADVFSAVGQIPTANNIGFVYVISYFLRIVKKKQRGCWLKCFILLFFCKHIVALFGRVISSKIMLPNSLFFFDVFGFIL